MKYEPWSIDARVLAREDQALKLARKNAHKKSIAADSTIKKENKQKEKKNE